MTDHHDEKFEDKEAETALEVVRRLSAAGVLSSELHRDVAELDTVLAAASTERGRAIREATKPLEEALAAYRAVNVDTAAQLKNALELLAQRKTDCVRFEEEARAARALVREVLAAVPAHCFVTYSATVTGDWLARARKLAQIPADTFTLPAEVSP